MDANFQRDEPGKSPMGMDLIPVYANNAAGKEDAGLVRITASVENNLGLRTAVVKSGPLNLEINTVG